MGMIKGLFGNRPTTRVDIILAAGAAVIAVVHFFDVKHQYKTENDEKKENEK